MQGRRKRVLSLALLTAAMACLLCIGVNAYTYPTMPSNWQDVEVTVGDVTMPLQQYPSGSIYDPNKEYMTVEEQAQYGITAGTDIWLRGWECVGFARYVYTALFYKYPQNATIDNHLAYDYGNSIYYRNMVEEVLGTQTLPAGYSAATLKTLFTACQPGAVMRVGGHSMVLMAIYDDGFIIYDANFSSDNEVNVRKYTWQSFIDSLGGRDILALQMPAYYPGYTYSIGSGGGTDAYPIDTSCAGMYVVYDCTTLNVRSAPSTSAAKVGSLDCGTTVEVLGSYGDWYAINYNARDRWVHSDYLKPALEACNVTFDANGGTASVTSEIYQVGEAFGSLPTAEKTNRELLGWYDGTTQYLESSKVPSVEELILKAKWCVLGFRDVEESTWYAGYVEQACLAGLTNGVAEGVFDPEASLSRGMLVTVLYRMEGEPEVDVQTPFTDLSAGRYYVSAVEWAYGNGIVNGMTETTFCPDMQITREQFATILYRYAQYLGATDPYSGVSLIYDFVDGADVSNYALDAMNWCVSEALIQGDNLGNLNPKNSTRRCEMATIIVRFMDYLEG